MSQLQRILFNIIRFKELPPKSWSSKMENCTVTKCENSQNLPVKSLYAQGFFNFTYWSKTTTFQSIYLYFSILATSWKLILKEYSVNWPEKYWLEWSKVRQKEITVSKTILFQFYITLDFIYNKYFSPFYHCKLKLKFLLLEQILNIYTFAVTSLCSPFLVFFFFFFPYLRCTFSGKIKARSSQKKVQFFPGFFPLLLCMQITMNLRVCAGA